MATIVGLQNHSSGSAIAPVGRTVHHEIIEISSDEDDSNNGDDDDDDDSAMLDIDHSPLQNAKHTGQAHALSPAAEFTSRRDGVREWSTEQPRQAKRIKVSHTDHDIDGARDRLGIPPRLRRHSHNRTDGSALPQAVGTSSEKLGYGDDRGTLTFRQNSHNESCTDSSTESQRAMRESQKASTASKREKAAPYFDDPNLGLRMYRGPGFELFPIVLGTMPEHQDVCDKWDQAQFARSLRMATQPAIFAQHETSNDEDTAGYSSEDEVATDCRPLDTVETRILEQILEIFPKIQHAFVLRKVRSITQVSDTNSANTVLQALVAEFLESKNLPKQDVAEKDDKDGVGRTIPLIRGDGTDKTYLTDSVALLAGHFIHVPTHHIYNIVHTTKSLYDSFLQIYRTEANYHGSASPRPYKRQKNARAQLEKKYASTTIRSHTNLRWRNLVNEMQAARQQVEREAKRSLRQQEEMAAEAKNLEEHRQTNSLITCQCCFDDEVPLNRTVPCDAECMHLFCYSCIQSLAGTQIGLMRYEMLCMDGSGCKAPLAIHRILLAIPSPMAIKLAFYQQQAEISAAGLEGLEQCAFCEFKAICDPIEIDSVFRCQNPDCARTTCRRCHEQAHGKKSCEEARNEKGLSARHRVEEARSEAMMRPCPNCKVKMIKELGCNKMYCTKCGCISCFVCKQDISDKKEGGYQHFHRGSCKLYDERGFDRHEHDADEAERKAIQLVREENADLDEKDLQIETGANEVEKTVPPPVTNIQNRGNPMMQGGLGVGPLIPPRWVRQFHAQHQLNPLGLHAHNAEAAPLVDFQAQIMREQVQLANAQQRGIGARHRHHRPEIPMMQQAGLQAMRNGPKTGALAAQPAVGDIERQRQPRQDHMTMPHTPLEHTIQQNQHPHRATAGPEIFPGEPRFGQITGNLAYDDWYPLPMQLPQAVNGGGRLPDGPFQYVNQFAGAGDLADHAFMDNFFEREFPEQLAPLPPIAEPNFHMNLDAAGGMLNLGDLYLEAYENGFFDLTKT